MMKAAFVLGKKTCLFICLLVHLRAAQIVKEYATKGDKIIGCMSTLAATATERTTL